MWSGGRGKSFSKIELCGNASVVLTLFAVLIVVVADWPLPALHPLGVVANGVALVQAVAGAGVAIRKNRCKYTKAVV